MEVVLTLYWAVYVLRTILCTSASVGDPYFAQASRDFVANVSHPFNEPSQAVGQTLKMPITCLHEISLIGACLHANAKLLWGPKFPELGCVNSTLVPSCLGNVLKTSPKEFCNSWHQFSAWRHYVWAQLRVNSSIKPKFCNQAIVICHSVVGWNMTLIIHGCMFLKEGFSPPCPSVMNVFIYLLCDVEGGLFGFHSSLLSVPIS